MQYTKFKCSFRKTRSIYRVYTAMSLKLLFSSKKVHQKWSNGFKPNVLIINVLITTILGALRIYIKQDRFQSVLSITLYTGEEDGTACSVISQLLHWRNICSLIWHNLALSWLMTAPTLLFGSNYTQISPVLGLFCGFYYFCLSMLTCSTIYNPILKYKA